MANNHSNTFDSIDLVDVAMGRKPATLVIRNGKWVCVQTGEVLPGTDIAVSGERIAYVGPDASHAIGPKTHVIDAAGRYLVPGLLDAHMHVESGMLTVTEFVRAVIPHGTTGMFVDPHEIANVFGLRGVRLMVDEAARQPIHVFVQVPSCVPSAPGLETPGESITPKDVEEAMNWKGIIGLGEVMNFPGVFNGDEKMHAEMAITRHAGKVIGGHYASQDLGLPFHGYAAGGPQDDHEGTRLEDAVSRARQGMHVMMRYGSAWHDVASQVRAVTEMGMDSHLFLLCTDDSHSETLLDDGHMDRVVRFAVSCRLDPVKAIQMATINTAEYFGVSRDMGQIAPGRYADILLVEDINQFKVGMVFSRGKLAAENGKLLIDLPKFHYPGWTMHSVCLPRPLSVDDFRITTSSDQKVSVNVIGVIENQAPTHHIKVEITPKNREICVDGDTRLAKIALVDRHHNNGKVQVGLVSGFGLNRPCAVATTVAHDCHNMIIMGTDDANMALAGNTLVECGGGQVVVADGKIIGQIELPIAGLMSTEHASNVAKKARTILDGFKACGCSLNNANMTLSLLALVVIPNLRISDLGLIDVTQFKIIPLIEDLS
jgi:adenine deaminase